jgi:preprotein translocase subunit YajC
VNPLILVFIVMIGVMFLMTRSAKNKQRQASEMRNKMEPGSGVRTIGGIYAVVKEVNDETVLLELTDGVHVHFARNAIATVLNEDEFNRIVHGIEPEEIDEDDTDAVTGDTAAAEDGTDSHQDVDADLDEERIDLTKTEEASEQRDGSGTK